METRLSELTVKELLSELDGRFTKQHPALTRPELKALIEQSLDDAKLPGLQKLVVDPLTDRLLPLFTPPDGVKRRGRRPRTREEFETAFWSKVDKTDNEDGCWLWQGPVNTNSGYSNVWFQGKQRGVHAVAFFLKHNRFPSDQALHKPQCSKLCVRPDHIRDGTPADNARDTWIARRAREVAADPDPPTAEAPAPTV